MVRDLEETVEARVEVLRELSGGDAQLSLLAKRLETRRAYIAEAVGCVNSSKRHYFSALFSKRPLRYFSILLFKMLKF